MSTLVTLGEQLGRVTSWQEGPLRPGSAAELSVCGAEAAVAIGVRRLGVGARFLGRVGDDAFGVSGGRRGHRDFVGQNQRRADQP